MSKTYILVLALLLSAFVSQAQIISGKVLDNNGEPLTGANIFIEGTTTGTQVDFDGNYSMSLSEQGTYTIIASYVGFITNKQVVTLATENIQLDFTLEEDQLGLDEIIVTGVFNEKTKLESSVAITSIRPAMISRRLPRGTGDLLNAVPGTYVDNSGGEVGNRIYARGMASGTVDDTGYRYVSLQEDGLPIMSSLVQFASADMFSRVDVNVARLEAIRGGSSAVTAPNAPGGIYNFISKEGGNAFAGDAIIKMGINGQDNVYSRTDVGFGGPLSDNGWSYYIGGFYRYDEGARNIPFVANKGGQVKGNIVKVHNTGKIKLYGKYLDDQVTQYRPIPLKDFQSLEAFEGSRNPIDVNYGSTLPNLQAQIPDYTYGKEGQFRDFDSNRGIDIKNYAFGLEIIQDLGEWTLTNNMKYTKAAQRYMQYVANVVIPMPIAFAGLGLGGFADFASINDAQTGELLYRKGPGDVPMVDKMGGNLFLTFPLDMNNDISDFMNRLTLSRSVGNHRLSFGAFVASSTLKATWSADILAGTLEPNSRPVYITHPNPIALAGVPGQPANLEITDPNGFLAYNNITTLGFEGTSNMQSFFINDQWSASDKLNLDFGIRYDRIAQNGFKRGWDRATGVDPFIGIPVGADGNYATLYDATTRKHNETKFEYDESYNMLAFSLGANYKIDDSKALFARVSKGNKAPDHEWYISNFENVPIERGTVEKVYQAEAGVKMRGKNYSVFLTGFYSYLDDITYQAFITSSNTTFFTPPTFNTARTVGLELEANASLFKGFDIRVLATLQDPRYVDFALYNTNGTSPSLSVDASGNVVTLQPLLPAGTEIRFLDTPPTPEEGTTNSDDYYEDMSGNQVNEVPTAIFDVTASYTAKKFGIFFNTRYTGKYQYNKRNDFKMPDYWVFNGGVSYEVADNLQLALQVNNLFNSVGVTRTEGAALLDGNKEFFTKEFLEQHQKSAFGTGQPGSVWGVPILPRLTTLSLIMRIRGKK